MRPARSFATRLSLALALLLLVYGAFVALLGRQVAADSLIAPGGARRPWA